MFTSQTDASKEAAIGTGSQTGLHKLTLLTGRLHGKIGTNLSLAAQGPDSHHYVLTTPKYQMFLFEIDVSSLLFPMCIMKPIQVIPQPTATYMSRPQNILTIIKFGNSL